MPRNPIVLPESEGAVRSWTRDLNLPNVARRVFFGVPKKTTDSSWPMILMMRVGGFADRGDVAIDHPLIQYQVFGLDKTDRARTALVATDLAEAVTGLSSGTPMGASAVGLRGTVETGPLWNPDPDDDRAGYRLDVSFSIRVL